MSKELQDFLAYADKRGQEDPDPEVREVCNNLVEQLSEQNQARKE